MNASPACTTTRPAKRRLLAVLIRVCGVGALCCLSALSQVSPGNLAGTVTDVNGAPLKGARVTLLARNISVTTDAGGKYLFPGTTGLREIQAAGERKVESYVADNRMLFSKPGTQSPNSSYSSLGRRIKPLADPESQRVPFESQSEILPKAAAESGDTLCVIAMGFDRADRMISVIGGSQDFKLTAIKFTNIPYKTGNLTAAEKAVCILDVHVPKTGSNWPVVIHLHGGGMTGGSRNEGFDASYNYFGNKFLDAGVMEVTPGYRLVGSGGTWPDYIRDAAAAAVWVQKNIEPYGGDPKSVFVTGFSAGAYLTHMLAIDSTWFGELNFDPHRFAGFVSMSGQTRQHANIAMDLKVSDIMAEKPYAMPMGHIHKTDLPWQIFVGGNEGQTITDNQTMFDALIKAGSTDLYMDVIPNQPHTCSDMADPVSIKRDKFLAFINKYKAK